MPLTIARIKPKFFQEILHYCTADEIEGKPGGAKNGVERLLSKSPSPEKSRTHKMNISFSDSEDDETEIEVEMLRIHDDKTNVTYV